MIMNNKTFTINLNKLPKCILAVKKHKKQQFVLVLKIVVVNTVFLSATSLILG